MPDPRPAAAAVLVLALGAMASPVSPASPAGDPPPVAAAPAVRVYALDGRTLTGKEFTLRGADLVVASDAGEAMLPLAEVLEASVDIAGAEAAGGSAAGTVEVEFADRDFVRGVLVRGAGEDGFVVRSEALGEMSVPLHRVAAVRFAAAFAKADDPPPLVPGEGTDRVFFAGGDRLDGTLRSVDARTIRIRTAAGADRDIPVEGVLGFALAPLPAKPEQGLCVRVLLRDRCRVSASVVAGSSRTGIELRGMAGNADRTVAAAQVAGLTVRGGSGTPLADLEPASVEVRPYWGDDAPALPTAPRFDRAFTLDPGPPPALRLGGRTYARGVSVYSGTTLAYDLAGMGLRRFVAAVGVDDAGPKGAVEFEVLVDGKSAWRSGEVRALAPGAEPLAVPPVDLTGASRLELRVHAGADEVQDYADWVRAALLK